ncbi:nucleoside 2-deoxyribosyltransferase domain-containing protein [Candidatus Albibeggiatoa sp. nov. NOAA]|uniref:nucleoside 2-deoxyribosyltransferase domain-containing protein n=1 Tax=Candidatus Albibeggiatoa sp. nov. NOAA TaxID=3162724 RepID=UPI0033022508|nr:nucleoside 2-deoxyribosyltransferase domain-containing protein [Thiotrichaceae bacterium]
MATVYKPPQVVDFAARPSVFFAGTIDNGNSEDWQASVETKLADLDVSILNPRRDNWDASWEQTIHNPQFKQQVVWELNGLDAVSVIFMYFAPNSQSPITLLELGLMAESKKMLLVSPQGFWRRGNIEVVAERYQIPLIDDLDTGIEMLRQSLQHVAEHFHH